MERITGLRTIWRGETKAGCSHLYDAAVISPGELNGVPVVNIPPGIDVYIYVYTDPRAVDTMSQTLQDPRLSSVSGLGGDAGWDSTGRRVARRCHLPLP